METYEQLQEKLKEQRLLTEQAEARALAEQQQRETEQKQRKEAEARAKTAEARALVEQQQRKDAEALALVEQQQRKAADASAKAAEDRAKAADARAKAADARALAEQQQREAEQKQRKAAEEAVKRTDYHTFLSLCHKNLFEHMTIQEDPNLSAAGTFTNADAKHYPLCLKPWADFPSLHKQCQGRLESLFKNGLIFPAAAGFDLMNELVAFNEPLADENDVRFLKDRKAALPTTDNETSQHDDNNNGEDSENNTLPTRVYFSNTPYGILLDEDTSDESQHSDTKPAYLPAMLEAQVKDAAARGRPAGDGPPPAKRTTSPMRKFHPDQWLLRANNDGSIIPVLVVEYKAAHKLRGSTLKLALDNTARGARDLFASAIYEKFRNKVDNRQKDRIDAEKATALVIAQAFHYMVEFGLCYSYVASGEALVLLYLDAKDVRTLYYHLALPKEEVGSGTEQNVQRSSVALVSTMALLALDTPVLSQRWKREAEDVLRRWPTPYDEMSLPDNSSDEEKTGKLTAPPRLPPRQIQQACQDDIEPQRSWRNDSDDDNNDPVFRPPKSRQACILGLRNGGPLDDNCPNVQLHPLKNGRHTLTAERFCQLLRDQLADDLDENCDALDKFGKFGAVGMLFRLTLQGYGYCVVAKGVQRVHAALLTQEASIYQYLYEQQGTLVPVYIGIIDLVDVYRTSFGARVAHMMVMSYAGEPVGSKASRPLPDNIDSLEYEAWAQLQQLGVDHGDERNPNLLWNAPLQRLMCIDFERSKIISRKRKHRVEKSPPPEPSSAGWDKARTLVLA
ncbi:hypothetical protein SPI_02191 [Niveomyces insectorum RCEF 264]|uniref:Metalloprotease m41 n=1 Tax=Niveomyces insectorum RCEF 264 TaxID=1081102 RepID=A0A167XU28_9HYPO|nr:hypothetical protein SPI_02191 [Niveomyces insectorum RCEF 264]